MREARACGCPPLLRWSTAAFGREKRGYRSGFQVGFGVNLEEVDNWSVYGEYTWYRNDREGLTQEFKYDDVHLCLSRPFYLGRRLTANVAGGLRGLWIKSNIGSYKQNSWAVGPKLMLDTNWLLGKGIKLFINFSESIVYTGYTNLSGVLAGDHKGSYGTLRTVTESNAGFGWDSYLGDNEEFHLGLILGYDFNVYWNQHLTREAVGQNLYLHGLNIGMRLDF